VGGETVPNRIVVPVGTNGKVSFFNNVGNTDLILDVGGWYTDGSDEAATGALYTPLTPARIADTRTGAAAPLHDQTLHTNTTRNVHVESRGNVAAIGANPKPTAVVVNVTVTGTDTHGFLTVFPDAPPPPQASDLNWAPGETVPNLVVVKLGSDGTLNAFNNVGNADVIVDVVGWYGTATG